MISQQEIIEKPPAEAGVKPKTLWKKIKEFDLFLFELKFLFG